jgi:YebC/PmpR family DNA-binding regulatory protein
MAGHSKWANIKRRKGAQDVRRGKLFTKLIREITVAAQIGGGDPDANPRLRAAVDKARGNSMPRDNITRAIAKGTGAVDMSSWEEIVFEGYGPGGVAVLVEVLTDNRNRSAGEVRHAFTKHDGNLGTTGCVAFLFNRCGIFVLDGLINEEDLMMAALDGGADDIRLEDENFEVVCPTASFSACRNAIHEAGFVPVSGELTWLPENWISVPDSDAANVMGLVETLEDCEDVQNVYTNADISEHALAAMD